MVPQRQIRAATCQEEVAVILISHERLRNWFFSDLAMLSRVVYQSRPNRVDGVGGAL
jgi:hypothetical protein